MSGVAENARTGIETGVRDAPGGGPTLVAVCGCPGVGKSTVARTLAEWLDATWLRTDAVRKELFEEPTYEPEESKSVYQTAMDRARAALPDRPVIVDASFADRRHRAAVQRVAAECGVPFTLLQVHCDESVTIDRIRDREDISDADVEVYHEIKDSFDPLWTEHITVDNSDSWDATVEQLEVLSLWD